MAASTDRVIRASALIHAPPGVVYDVVADYRNKHERILPKPPFVDLAVEEGGYGAGTVLRVRMKVFGATQTFRARVTEPEPGRVLVETNSTGYVTTFAVEPRADANQSFVTISTVPPGGVRGAIERLLVGRMLQRTYERELELLAEVVRAQSSAR